MLGEIVREGHRGRSLEALRDFYASRIVGASDKDAAVLGRRLEVVIAELEGLKGSDDGDTLEDELERRRMVRQGGVA